MKKTIIATALLTAGVFGVGYTAGQFGGVPGTSAAAAVTPTASQSIPDGSGPGGRGRNTPHADGTVTAINGDTLTIAAGSDPAGSTEYTGVTTVVLTGTTQFDAGHDSTGAINKSSITVGSYVIVDGTLSSDGKTITASRLGIHPGGPVPGR